MGSVKNVLKSLVSYTAVVPRKGIKHQGWQCEKGVKTQTRFSYSFHTFSKNLSGWVMCKMCLSTEYFTSRYSTSLECV